MKVRAKILIACVALLLQQCNPVNDFDSVTYRPGYLGPLAFSQLDPIEIAETSDKRSTYEVNPVELGIPGFAYNVPLTIAPIGPIDFPPEYTELQDIFAAIAVNEVVFTITFTNNLPVTISAGTEIVGRDSATNNLMFRHILPNDVAPGASYEGQQQETNRTLTSDLAISVENFRTPGASNVTFQDVDWVVTVDLNVLDLDEVLLRGNETFKVEATNPFSFDFSDESAESNPEGTLSLFVTNNLPTQASITLALQDDQGNTIYNFFGGSPFQVTAPTIDANGVVTAPVDVDLLDFIAVDTLDALSDATQLYSEVIFTTPAAATTLKVRDNNYIKLKISGDLEATLLQ